MICASSSEVFAQVADFERERDEWGWRPPRWGYRSSEGDLLEIPQQAYWVRWERGALSWPDEPTYEKLWRIAIHHERASDQLMLIGDSLTATEHFIRCFGGEAASFTEEQFSWKKIVDRWRGQTVRGVLSRESHAAQPGATSWELLQDKPFSMKRSYGKHRELEQKSTVPPYQPLARELRLNSARFASVLIGSNDAGYRRGDERFVVHLLKMIEQLTQRGVIPILHTVPDQTKLYGGRSLSEVKERLQGMNRAIQAMAISYGLPLIDLNRALTRLTHLGLREDGVHLSAYKGGCDLTKQGIRFGQNLRNYLLLELLSQLQWRERREGKLSDGAQKRVERRVQWSILTHQVNPIDEPPPCFDQVLSRARKSDRWRWITPVKEGPPVQAYGSWIHKATPIMLSENSRIELFTTLPLEGQGDLSRAQLWLEESEGECTPLRSILTEIYLKKGKHHVHHFARFDDHDPNLSMRPTSRVLLSW